jgi:ketosteroid isomerase-like protein
VSQQNVELLMRSNEAFRRADWNVWGATFDADVLIRTDPNWPERIIFGRRAAIEWGRSVERSLGTDVRIAEIKDLGDRLLARNVWKTQGQVSGVEGELAWSELLTVRDGKFVFVEMFFDHQHALNTLGLEG